MNLETLCQSVLVLTREVGAFQRQEVQRFDRTVTEFKGAPNNLVSYVDKESERTLVTGLGALLPEAGFITEEGTVEQAKEQEFVWVIDPLDGTTNFMHGYEYFTISIGLLKNKKPILGVIYDPSRDDMFYGWQGGGAFCNGRRMHTSAVTSLGQSLLTCGFPYRPGSHREAYLNLLVEIMDQTHGFRRLGSAAIDLAYVARGWFEGFFEYQLNSWDMAAGVLLIQEAGGIVTDFKGGDDYLFGGNVVAAAAGMQEELRQLLAKHMVD
ncbi:MAG: inositol monophosphatase [Cytophagaceae bacterium]|nr:inositol monophosphatase [Cytophagaceae bacterium]